MVKNKVFSSSVLIVLLIACVVFSMQLFGCASRTTGGGSAVTDTSASADASVSADNTSPPLVDDWVLPVVVSITGNLSDSELAAAWGFDYGVKTVNEQGGIRGIPVLTTVRDAASDDSKVSSEFGNVAADALIVVGPPTESLYYAGENAFFGAGMPSIGAATDETRRATLQPFAISCISDPGSAAGSAAAAWMDAEKFSSVCVFFSPSTQERTDYFDQALASGGKQIAEKIPLGNEAFDAAAIAEKAIASGADAYYLDTNIENALRIITQLKFQTNGSGAKILLGPLVASSDIPGADTEGVLTGTRVWASFDPGKDTEKRGAFNDAFAKNIGDESKYDTSVDYYQAAVMLKQAIDKLGLTGAPDKLASERELLAGYLYNSDTFTTVLGDFKIESGSKHLLANLYTVTANGFQS